MHHREWKWLFRVALPLACVQIQLLVSDGLSESAIHEFNLLRSLLRWGVKRTFVFWDNHILQWTFVAGRLKQRLCIISSVHSFGSQDMGTGGSYLYWLILCVLWACLRGMLEDRPTGRVRWLSRDVHGRIHTLCPPNQVSSSQSDVQRRPEETGVPGMTSSVERHLARGRRCAAASHCSGVRCTYHSLIV